MKVEFGYSIARFVSGKGIEFGGVLGRSQSVRRVLSREERDNASGSGLRNMSKAD